MESSAAWLGVKPLQPYKPPTVDVLPSMDIGDHALEPSRDWSIGLITGHRSRVLISITLITLGLYAYQTAFWPHGFNATGATQEVWSWGTLLWVGAILPSALGFLGLISFKFPKHLDETTWCDHFVSFRLVTRGTNISAVSQTIRRCQSEMKNTPLFRYRIEVVVDEGADTSLLPHGHDVVYIMVPRSYQTPNGSLYKARALQYALEHSTLLPTAWIIHLDEETQPTSSGIKGIAAMIDEEEESGHLRVGQGTILYHRSWRKHPFLTLADNVRTGDDLARFHFQHRLGVTLFGLHGSFIVVRNDVEESVGFDFGPEGSITEDAFWALKLMEAGKRCRWVNGYLEEQSTQSFGDFMRQRRRWFQGLVKVSRYAPVKLRWRLSIGINTFLWTLAPFAAIYTLIHFFYGFNVQPWVRLLANLSFAYFVTLYVIGLKVNMDEHDDIKFGWFRRILWTIAQICLTPFFSLMEACGVISALARPGKGFHVVKK